MKKFLAFLVAFMMITSAFAENALTVEDLETSMNIDIDTANVDVLKYVIDYFDYYRAVELKAFDDLEQKCLARLVALGETEWVNQYTDLNPSNLLSMNYGQLVELKNKINLAMWQSQEWQEVTVPQGTWKVGEDIPAGHWTVKCASGGSWAEIEWGEKLQANGEDISYYGRYSLYNKVYNPSRYTNKNEYAYEYSFTVEDGDYIKINYGSVVFMPYAGKPSFSFK